MTHDPLCPATGCHPIADECYCENGPHFCQCGLIDRVRDDQDRRNAARELTREAQDMGMIP